MKTIIPRWSTGYSVTLHTSGWMGFRRFPRLSQALEAAQSHALNRNGSAEVTPCASDSMRFNHRLILAVRYWQDSTGLQFLTTERS